MGLPEGVTLEMVAAVLIPVGIVTVLLRAFPYFFVERLKGSSFIEFLGLIMPIGVMTVLVVYTVSSAREAPGGMWAAIAAAVATLIVHAWRRSAALSIAVGTAAYMVLVNLVL